jgi:hypothetical protein
MQIRQHQLDVFQAESLRRADLTMSIYLRRRFPKELGRMPESDLLEKVSTRRSAARQYGIAREDDVATFLDLSVMYGDSFVDAEWAKGVLNCTALHGPDKVAVLRGRVEARGTTL